ncbi:D-alanyl-D-alanine carboxypeptidase family protein [Leucobacter sp. wl10]|uniref:D-alanyl-D-alanine carboxypeptidase family protein n=1 Tax=Leucobacter sp. wl10 TaxID=2304677 RepID=UPI001F0935A3
MSMFTSPPRTGRRALQIAVAGLLLTAVAVVGVVTGADGVLPEGASAFGVAFAVNRGWRSTELQARLLREAIAEYGSEAEAARWVASVGTSAHVSGDAVDIDGSDAVSWLSGSGAAYGLCQVYGNEPWHYELRPAAVQQGCPAQYADPSEDPRMG